MRFYLSSSYLHIGDKAKELPKLMPDNKKIGYIPNACDYTRIDMKRRNDVNAQDMADLGDLGLWAEMLDLKEYFGRTDALRKKLQSIGGVFVRGGNTFILLQAMHLSGFDILFKELLARDDFVYA